MLWALALNLPRPQGNRVERHHPHWPPQSFAVYYGLWDSDHLSQTGPYQMLIVHPGKELDRLNADLVSRLRSGPDGLPGNQDDRIVLAYLSLSEDESPQPGPRTDLGYYRDTQKLVMQDGFPLNGADGLPQWEEGQDGIPDRNGAWGSYYVLPDHPAWMERVLRRGRQLQERGVDGLLLDTVEVEEARQNGMLALLERLRREFPQLYLVSNRGLPVMARDPQRFLACLDGILLESWVSQWDWILNRAVPSPFESDNQKLFTQLLQGHPEFPVFYLDYLDPQQPDRGRILAHRGPRRPGFWSHPFLDRLTPGPSPAEGSLPLQEPTWEIQEGLVCVKEPAGGHWEAVALPSQRPLPSSGPRFAVGASTGLRLRCYDEQGRCSAWQEVALPAHDAPEIAWKVLASEKSLTFQWEGEASARVWMGDSPDQLQPTARAGGSPLVLEGLTTDQLYWVSLAFAEQWPEPTRAVRPADVTAPAVPQAVRARRAGQRLLVQWQAVEANDLAGYRIYLTEAGKPLSLPYEVTGVTHFQTPPLAREFRAEVWVTAVDRGNHESQPGRFQL